MEHRVPLLDRMVDVFVYARQLCSFECPHSVNAIIVGDTDDHSN